MEKEEVEETPVEKQYKIDLVTEKSLKNNIIYVSLKVVTFLRHYSYLKFMFQAEHVKKSEKLFKGKLFF